MAAKMYCLRNFAHPRYSLFSCNIKNECGLKSLLIHDVKHYHVSVPSIKRSGLPKQCLLSRRIFTGREKYQNGVLSISAIRLASTDSVPGNPSSTVGTPPASTHNIVADVAPIPEPPKPLMEVIDAVQSINLSGEPPFSSIGLGGYSPVGLIHHCMEFLHITCDLPWWGCIAIGTLTVRLCLFPLVIMAQRNAARMSNHMPEMTVLQNKLSDARHTGNRIEAARYSQELFLFMKEKQLSPFKNMMVPFVQAPIFISFFIALRRMVNAPVESLKTGGLFWFTDLTVADQYYLLPLITSATMSLVIEVGSDSMKLSSAGSMKTMRYVFRALPVVMFPFIMNFQGAILCYWVTTNAVSLIQVSILRIPTVREYFKIEPYKKHDASLLPKQPGFMEGIKDTWANSKILKELENRERYNELRFQRAGANPVVKTYKFDPTKSRDIEKSTAVSAKSRQ